MSMSIEERRVLGEMERHLKAEEPELVAIFDGLEQAVARMNDPKSRWGRESVDLIILMVVVVFLVVASLLAVAATGSGSGSPSDRRPPPSRYVVNVPPERQTPPAAPPAERLPAARW